MTGAWLHIAPTSDAGDALAADVARSGAGGCAVRPPPWQPEQPRSANARSPRPGAPSGALQGRKYRKATTSASSGVVKLGQGMPRSRMVAFIAPAWFHIV